ncbi:SDR family NAD(P)-dependent oxidoreductase, partial [bacterium]|nr:SDR family NAD(P)-dependent oxidoreductase [bacterium]
IDHLKKQGVSFEVEDISSKRKASSFDAVVHFGGFSNIHTDYAADVVGTKKLLAALNGSKKLRRFVSIGSAAEYGVHAREVTERTQEKPVSEYGKARLAQTKLIARFAQSSKVKTFNLRLFNILGLHKDSHAKEASSLVESFLMQFSHSFDGTIRLSNKKSVRDFIDIDDAVSAIWSALTTEKGGAYECVNISSGSGVALSRLIKVFGTVTGRNFSIQESSASSDYSVGNNAKAKRILSWKPKTSLTRSVEKLLAIKKRVLIVGAGVAGRKVIEEIRKEERADIFVAGFIDDDASKHGLTLEGFPIFGGIQDLPRVAADKKIDQVLISTPSAEREVLRRVMELLPAGFPVKVLPSISSVILGNVDLSNIRDLDLSDLIGRPLVKADQQRISDRAKGKTFLVTGGAGSIGSEVVRQLHNSQAKKIIVIDSWEEGVYHLLEELHAHSGVAGHPELCAYVGNVRDQERLEEILSQHNIDVIIHAAAYKHVPLMEDNASEAHKTNVGGTVNLLGLAIKNKIKDFLLISTDKAVNPVNVMGQTKRDAELLLKQHAQEYAAHRFCAVRFGNVVNSSGSVIPKFLKQIKSRSPVTVTHRDMTR